MINWRDTVIAQYANSPTILWMIENFNEAIDPTDSIKSFYDNIWNPLTAIGVGLDIWGRIVGVNRVIPVPTGLGWAEFEEQGLGSDAFGTLPLYSGGTAINNYALDDTSYRRCIFAKAFANISRTSIPNYNKLLMMLFPNRGNAYMNDTGSMTMQAYFTFLLEPFEVTLLKQSGIVQPPTGVKLTITDTSGTR